MAKKRGKKKKNNKHLGNKVDLKSYKVGAALAIIAGLLLISANAIGSAGIIGLALEYMINFFSGPISDILSHVLQLLNIIASLGGIAVIGGGILIYIGRLGLGKFIIGLGAGIGLIAYLIAISSAIIPFIAIPLAIHCPCPRWVEAK